jgi:fermentation-respiration switch protein FrsA (DUF1100 family)
METIFRAFLYVVVGYALFVTVIYFFQRSLMYFPDTGHPDRTAAGVPDMEELRLATADGLELLSWYKPPAISGGATIVYFQGNGGNIDLRGGKARTLIDAGYGVLLVGYRGYGGNAGRPDEQGLYKDGRAAVLFLRERGIGLERIVLYGESLGSGVAVQLAAEQRMGALILEAPFISAARVGSDAYPFLPVSLLIKDRFDNIDKIRNIKAPVLVLHGRADRVVGFHHGAAILEAANEPKESFFPRGVDHVDMFAYGAAPVVLGFLDRHLGR